MVSTDNTAPVIRDDDGEVTAGFWVRLVAGSASAGAAFAGAGLALVVGRWEPFALGAAVMTVVWGLLMLRHRMLSADDPPPCEPRLALARIEERRAENADGADVPLLMDLTVAPDDAPAFRVRVRHHVNLVDLQDYPVGRNVVVRYRPDAAWEAEFVERPDPVWVGRARDERLDSAPEETRVDEPLMPGSHLLAALAALAAGAAAVPLLFTFAG